MSKSELKKWKTTSSTYLVHDRWIKLRADTCTTVTGHEISPFYVMEFEDWADCLVISDDNEVTLLRHYRHGIDDYVLEIVGGGIDKGETPEAAIRLQPALLMCSICSFRTASDIPRRTFMTS